MLGFWLILGGIVFGNLAWWAWADRRLRPLPVPALWRTMLAIFVLSQIAYLAAFFLAPQWARQSHRTLPASLLGVFYLWALVVLPVAGLLTLLVYLGRLPFTRRDRRKQPPPVEAAREPIGDTATATPRLTRRQLLAAAAVVAPPLFTGIGVAYGRRSLYDLRVRRAEIFLSDLPPDLAGLTIAHISDTHVGKFVGEDYLRRTADVANGLNADLHLLTGDLIDLSIGDLPEALDFVARLQPRHGLVMCEGNHDLIDDPRAFYAGVRARGVPLLVDDAMTLTLPGRSAAPIRLLGLRWGAPGSRSPNEAGYADSVRGLTAGKRDGEFPILLAHHPHAFDAAAAAGIPLTLSGHTHGGLLMLSETVGPGPLLYRYWSGLYRKPNAQLFVSNGVGSWFPVRTHAQPEIVHLTLRRA
jgi:predicted MPP superfamily phosphohydrolase